MCSEGCEDIRHIIFTYRRAKEVWQKLGKLEHIERVQDVDRSGSIILEEIIRQGGQVTALNKVGLAELIIARGWYMWWERRKLVHGEQLQTTSQSAMSIATLTINYQNASKKKPVVREGWKKPTEGFLKLNVYASFDENSGIGGTGAIIRDYTGGFVAAAQATLIMWAMQP